MKTKRTGHAEPAAHLTADLGGDTQRGPILFGDIDRFDELLSYRKEVFACAIDTDGLPNRVMTTDCITCLKGLTTFEGYIGHGVKIRHTPDVEPLRELLPCELLQTDTQRHVLQFSQCFA